MTNAWPDAAWLRSRWPLPEPLTFAVVGSGLRVVDADGHAWHLKRREPARLVGELFVLAELSDAGVRVTAPAPTADGPLAYQRGGWAYWLYPELDGRPIEPIPASADAATRAAWRGLGLATARLQGCLRQIDPDSAERRGVPVRHASVAPAPTGVQLIHGDLHAGNVLVGDAGKVGYLDFDHLTIGPRLVDPCYASGSLLARLLETRKAVEERWLCLTGSLLAGWCAGWRASGLPVTLEELDAVPATFVEIEDDFRAWLAESGDWAGVALTDRMNEVARRRSADLIALVREAR